MFSEANKILIVKTANIDRQELERHLVYQGELVTAAIETAVLELITEYNAIPKIAGEFFPTESNKGFKLSNNDRRAEIREEIFRLIGYENRSGYRLQRG